MDITEEEIIDAANESYYNAGHNVSHVNGFMSGVEFALNQVKNNVVLDGVSKCKCKFPKFGGVKEGQLGFSQCDKCNKPL